MERPDLLVTAPELAAEMAGPQAPRLLDVRWRLGDPGFGRADYARGHIPGAAFVDLDTELSGPPGEGGRHPRPTVEAFERAMRAAGVDDSVPVVVCDAADATAAARAWWLLRDAGHARVRVLDGGLRAWVDAGLELEHGAPDIAGGDFHARPGALPTIDASGAAELARLGVLLDARAAERFRGEVEPIDPVAGHIPGARSAPTSENVDATGHFRDSGALRSRFDALGATAETAVGAYCGSGVTAAHTVLALALAGVDAALYPGSWSEWIVDPARPVATGG